MRLFLVRHGQVAANKEFRYVGRRDDELTPLGVEQAALVGESLQSMPLEALYSSPLRRTQATAEKIANGQNLEVILDERLREQWFGRWEGLSREEIRGLGGADAKRLGQFDVDPGVAAPGGESLVDVQVRVVSFVDGVATSGLNAVAVVSHVGPIKALLAAALDISLLSARRLFLDPGTVTVVDWGDRSLLRLFNAQGPVSWGSPPWLRTDEPRLRPDPETVEQAAATTENRIP